MKKYLVKGTIVEETPFEIEVTARDHDDAQDTARIEALEMRAELDGPEFVTIETYDVTELATEFPPDPGPWAEEFDVGGEG